MSGRIIIAVSLVIAIAGCSRIAESRFNPFNWFGRAERVQTVTAPGAAQSDPRRIVAQVITLKVEPAPGGAIIRATGLPPFQGYYDGELVPLGDEAALDGVLNYQFRISPPLEQTRVSTQRSREVVVARFVSTQTLVGVRQIVVHATGNALSVRR